MVTKERSQRSKDMEQPPAYNKDMCRSRRAKNGLQKYKKISFQQYDTAIESNYLRKNLVVEHCLHAPAVNRHTTKQFGEALYGNGLRLHDVLQLKAPCAEFAYFLLFLPFEIKNNIMKEGLHTHGGKVSNSVKLKMRGERGLGKVRRRKFRKGYMQLRMCDKRLFVTELMKVLGMDWANAVRVCRIGLAATHQKAGASAFVEELFNRFNIQDVWDE